MSPRTLALTLAVASLVACGPRARLPVGPPPEYEEPEPAFADAAPADAAVAQAADAPPPGDATSDGDAGDSAP